MSSWQEQRKWVKKGFFLIWKSFSAYSCWFDRFQNVSFPVILLFGALSLSPVWPNIEGRQDLIDKTPIIFFYSDNNPDSLNRPSNTNLIAVQCWKIKLETLKKKGKSLIKSKFEWFPVLCTSQFLYLCKPRTTEVKAGGFFVPSLNINKNWTT